MAQQLRIQQVEAPCAQPMDLVQLAEEPGDRYDVRSWAGRTWWSFWHSPGIWWTNRFRGGLLSVREQPAAERAAQEPVFFDGEAPPAAKRIKRS